jgi:hypothetical protein
MHDESDRLEFHRHLKEGRGCRRHERAYRVFSSGGGKGGNFRGPQPACRKEWWPMSLKPYHYYIIGAFIFVAWTLLVFATLETVLFFTQTN